MKKKIFKILNIKSIYIFICFIFRILISFFQDKLLRINSANNLDYFSFKTYNSEYLNIINQEFKELKLKYQDIMILDKKTINKLIREIFNQQNRNLITKITGYKYNIDYCILYKNYHIPKKKSHLSYYANLIHKDKPYSKNMLKIIIPLSVKTSSDGPLSIEKRGIQKRNYNNTNPKMTSFLSNDDNTLFYGFNPSKVLHKALIPLKNHYCYQIMIQLNPSKSWKINQEIQSKQIHKEPKFPEISYLFDSYCKI
tara:strand:+ start:242 stop:1003 length:762 start_codon:yes stop_codon:yes gene_type:complete